MSKMKDLAYDIEQLYIDGMNAGQIARELGVPASVVLDWIADHGLRSFSEWDKNAQDRLIRDLRNPALV